MQAQYIDIGINLMHRSYAHDREQVIEQAKKAGVTPLIITGTSVRASQQAASFAIKHKGCLYFTAGVHPHDAKSCDETTVGELRRLSMLPQAAAIGECGLDYDRDFSPRPVQRKWFEKQIELALEEDMPLFLHERKAFDDFRSMLKEHQSICSRSVVHCFTGTRKELEAYLELGCYIGITGWICDERRGKALRDIVKNIPPDRLMIETDGPFLTPRNLPVKPKNNRNEPAYLPHIAAEIAGCCGVAPEEIAAAAARNTIAFFNLDA